MSLFLVKNSVFVKKKKKKKSIFIFLALTDFSIPNEDVKHIQVWKPRNKDVLFFFFAASKILVFSKNMHFCKVLLNLFKTTYCFVIHEVQHFKIVLRFKNLFEDIF